MNSSYAEAQNLIASLKAELNEANMNTDERLLLIEGRLKEANEKLTQAKTHAEDILALLGENLTKGELESDLASLSSSVKEKLNLISTLNSVLSAYKNVTGVDAVSQGEIIIRINDLLANPPVKITENEDGTKTEGKASVSLYYLDLLDGISYTYNEKEVFGGASVIKLFYVYSLLCLISDKEELAYEAARIYREEQEALPGPDAEAYPEYIFEDARYDLSDTVVFDSQTMKVEGSGVIKNMEDGTVFTYRDLVYYTVTQSDNIAFDLLRERFGYDFYYTAMSALGVRNTLNSFYSMSASDCIKVLKAVYDFIAENERYGSFLYDAMIRTNHRVIIPINVYPRTALNKYGWDINAYHDIAIVLGNKPYLLSVMTDLDEGNDSKEVREWLNELIKSVNALHEGFSK